MESHNVKTSQEVGMPESGLRNRAVARKCGRHAYAVAGEEYDAKLVGFVGKQLYVAVQASAIEGS